MTKHLLANNKWRIRIHPNKNVLLAMTMEETVYNVLFKN